MALPYRNRNRNRIFSWKSKWLFIAIFIFIIFFVTAYSNDSTVEEPEITVAAASSLQQAFTELSAEFTKQSGIKVTLTFGSTGQLSHQLEQGAPYDLFASADEIHIDALIDKGLLEQDSKSIYGYGRIGFIYPNKSSLNHESFEMASMLHPKTKAIAIANPNIAPYGKAAQESLQYYDLWDDVKDKIVYTQNIRQVQQLVETGNADIGITSLSLQAPALAFTLIAEESHQLIGHALGISIHTRQKEMTEQYTKFILSSQGHKILREYGFYFPE